MHVVQPSRRGFVDRDGDQRGGWNTEGPKTDGTQSASSVGIRAELDLTAGVGGVRNAQCSADVRSSSRGREVWPRA